MSNSDGTCSYVLDSDDPETWGGEDGEIFPPNYTAILDENGVWSCPYNIKNTDEDDYCIFHNDEEQDIRKEIKHIVPCSGNDKKIEIFGSNLGEVHLKYLDVGDEDTVVDLSFSKIKNLRESREKISCELRFCGVTVTGR